MGITICPVHGRMHITTCCVHIADAVDANSFERAYVVVDRSGTHHVLCERCRAQAESRLVDSAADPGSSRILELDPPLDPYCHQHLIEWYAATGQGNLSEAIA